MLRGTPDQSRYPSSFAYVALTLFGPLSQTVLLEYSFTLSTVHTPSSEDSGLGYFHFARHYSGNHFCFLFLRVLRCFSSPSSPPLRDTANSSGFPHSDMSGSTLACQLPEPFRRLLRPSSPPVAKASTVCTCSLDHITRKSLNFGSYVFYRTFYGTSLPYFTITRCLSQRTMICA